MVIDPRLLTTEFGDTIDGHRLCPKCEYDLIGLKFGGRCPECGAPISRKRARGLTREGLTDAPTAYVRKLHAACVVLAVLAVAMPICRVAVAITANVAVATILFMVTVLWLAAAWIATEPRPRCENAARAAELLIIRMFARITQVCWVLGALAVTLAFIQPGGFFLLRAAEAVFELIAVVGLVPLAIWLAHIAEWASDDALATRLYTSAITIVVTGGFVLLAAAVAPFIGVLGSVLLMGAFLAFVVCLIALIFFIIALVQMAIMTRWAIGNAEIALEIDEQMSEIAAVRAAARAAEIERVEDVLGIQFDEPTASPGPAFHGHRIEHDDDLNPYDVAD